MRGALEVLIPVSLLSLVVSYLCSCLPCYLHSVASLLRGLGQLTARKPTSMHMLLFSNVILLFLTVRGSCLSTADHNPTSFLTNPFDDAPLTAIKHRRDDPFMSTDAGEEQAEEKRVIEESVVMRSAVGNELELVLRELAAREEMERGGCGWEEMGVIEVENELDMLDIDELNKRFDEFIGREKRKWRLEALQLLFV